MEPMFIPNLFYKLIKMTFSMCLTKLNEIERFFLNSKIILWSEN